MTVSEAVVFLLALMVVLYCEAWLDWRKENKDQTLTLSISEDVRDPYLRCLAWRRVFSSRLKPEGQNEAAPQGT
jgi:hypothetical protein